MLIIGLMLSIAIGAQEVQTDSVVVASDSLVIVTDSVIVLTDSLLIDTLQADTAQPPSLKQEIQKAPIYQGATLKLDIGSTAMVVGMSLGKIQHYEMAVNVRLKNRFYPTLEVGYAGGTAARGDTTTYKGQGGFFRVGCDINPLKKHPESPHAMLIGIRLGAAVQDYTQPTNGSDGTVINAGGIYADCWGEIVGGCQVEMARVGNTAFYMGWQARFRALFTRTLTPEIKATIAEDTVDYNPYMPIYIPGFGKRDNIGWGLSYHIGWRF